MHYANGKEAKAGDLVYLKTVYQTSVTETIGLLICGQATGSTCNAQMQPIARRYASDAGQGPWMSAASPYQECVTVNQLMPFDPPVYPDAANHS